MGEKGPDNGCELFQGDRLITKVFFSQLNQLTGAHFNHGAIIGKIVDQMGRVTAFNSAGCGQQANAAVPGHLAGGFYGGNNTHHGKRKLPANPGKRDGTGSIAGNDRKGGGEPFCQLAQTVAGSFNHFGFQFRAVGKGFGV